MVVYMTYQSLQALKALIKEFREDKTKYDPSDILVRMKRDISEQMAVLGYQSLEQNGRTVEGIFVENLNKQLATASRKEFNGVTYIKALDVRYATEALKLKSIF